MNSTIISKMLDIQKLLEENPFIEVYGQEKVKKGLKSALLVGRHIILVGPPGIGKTTLAKNISRLLPNLEVNDCEYNCTPSIPMCPACKLKQKNNQEITKKEISGKDRFVRIQGSPDLTVEDLLGDIDPIKALEFGPLSIEAFTPGKIFLANNGILFFDEVNRCSEKLQNALLQVLEEGFATIGSYKVDLPANFIFIGTMNPNDASTEKLSDVFLDRCDLLYVKFPETIEIEKQIVKEKSNSIKGIEFPENLLHCTVQFIRDLRESDKLEKKPSVRASMGLYERAIANAKISSRGIVRFKDIREAIESVLSHRIELKPSVKYLQKADEFIKQEFQEFMEKHQDLIDDETGGDG